MNQIWSTNLKLESLPPLLATLLSVTAKANLYLLELSALRSQKNFQHSLRRRALRTKFLTQSITSEKLPLWRVLEQRAPSPLLQIWQDVELTSCLVETPSSWLTLSYSAREFHRWKIQLSMKVRGQQRLQSRKLPLPKSMKK